MQRLQADSGSDRKTGAQIKSENALTLSKFASKTLSPAVPICECPKI